MILATCLTATVNYSEVRTDGPNGRRKILTQVTIKAADITVATKTLAGRWSQQQALKEFKRLPKPWTIHNIALINMPIAA